MPLLEHRAEKWTQFSAPNDALIQEESIGWIPKVDSTFGSDALAAARDNSLIEFTMIVIEIIRAMVSKNLTPRRI